jgi:hypothetical protein
MSPQDLIKNASQHTIIKMYRSHFKCFALVLKPLSPDTYMAAYAKAIYKYTESGKNTYCNKKMYKDNIPVSQLVSSLNKYEIQELINDGYIEVSRPRLNDYTSIGVLIKKI